MPHFKAYNHYQNAMVVITTKISFTQAPLNTSYIT